MGIKLIRSTGKYSIYLFSEEHNHPLIRQDFVHMMPSHRKITSCNEAFLSLTSSSGLTPKSAFELMGQQVGGRESLGFTKVDQKNYLASVRQKSILVHVQEVYTKTMFRVFEAQFEASYSSSITKCVSDGENFVFTVVRDGFVKERLVKREGQFTVSCSCRMFETIGILCRHCIKVMSEGRETYLIKKIPDKYVLARWTKNARVGNVVQDMHGHEIVENPKLQQTSRYRSLCSKFVRLASRASESEKTYEAVDMEADNLVKLVEDMLRVKINSNEEVEGEAPNVLVGCSNDLTISNAKGFKKREATHRGKRRAKGSFEAQISKHKKKPGQVPMYSPMMGGNGTYMPLFVHPYNGHQMTWMPQEEFPRPLSQDSPQPNTMGFSFAHDTETSTCGPGTFFLNNGSSS